jgi:uncharacterized membrane protein YvbJ
MPPEICPHCGAEVPSHARACPECGSDEVTGWSESAAANGLGLPDEEFNYQRFLEEEFGETRTRPSRRHWLWWGVALAVVVALLLMVLGRHL